MTREVVANPAFVYKLLDVAVTEVTRTVAADVMRGRSVNENIIAAPRTTRVARMTLSRERTESYFIVIVRD